MTNCFKLILLYLQLYNHIAPASHFEGGWIEMGIDAGAFSRELMNGAKEFASKENSLIPGDMLASAYFSTTSLGTCTACIIALEGNEMKGKYSKRRRSNVAVIHVRIVFIGAFLFYCLLLNHNFPTNPNKITNCFKLILLYYNFTTYICSMRSLF